MTGAIACFLLEPSDQVEVSLRRYARTADPCPLPHGYHDASRAIARVMRAEVDCDPASLGGPMRPELDADDPRWPTHCNCGRAFLPADHRQHQWNTLMRRADTGALFTLAQAPVGAMWFAPWLTSRHKGPDGRCLVVKTPGGDWTVDGPATNGCGWTRTGTPPHITAHPSIGMLKPDGSWRYHGWLRDGVLVPA